MLRMSVTVLCSSEGHAHQNPGLVLFLNRVEVPDEVVPHIFLSILVHCQMYGAKRPPSDLLLYQVLVDAVFGCAIILAVAVLGACIECFL